jgi:hypothetical protein
MRPSVYWSRLILNEYDRMLIPQRSTERTHKLRSGVRGAVAVVMGGMADE